MYCYAQGKVLKQSLYNGLRCLETLLQGIICRIADFGYSNGLTCYGKMARQEEAFRRRFHG